MTNTPVIDRETIDALREMDAIATEDHLLLELIDDFLFHSADLVKAIQFSLQMKLEPELAAQSHSLKGASLNIGALVLFQVCDTLETLARQHQLSQMDYWSTELHRAYQQTALILTEMRSRTERGETIDDLLG